MTNSCDSTPAVPTADSISVDSSFEVELEEFFAGYRPRSWCAAQVTEGLDRLLDLVRAAEPRSLLDARTMLASASHFLFDVAPSGRMPVDELLCELTVARWGNMRRDQGANRGSLSNDLQRLRRLLRVRRGLPARLGVPRDPDAPVSAPLSPSEQFRAVEQLRTAAAPLAAAYVAAVGANLVGARAVGGRVELADGCVFVRDGERHPIVGHVQALARRVVGVEVTADAWGGLRALLHRAGVPFDADRVFTTHGVAALTEPAPAAVLIARYGLSRREIDRARGFLPTVGAGEWRDLLLG